MPGRKPKGLDAGKLDEAFRDLRVSPQSLQLQTVAKLRAAISEGLFEPGERLVESRLCSLFGVSRPLIREALRSVEAEKLVLMVPNSGPVVVSLTWQEAAEIYSVRSLLEGEAASLCAVNISADGLKALKRATDAFERAVKRNSRAEELTATASFYKILLKECGNKLIRELLEGLFARINLLRVQSMSRPMRSVASAQELRAILEAVEAGDAAGARAAATRHVEKACHSARLIYEDSADSEAGSGDDHTLIDGASAP